MPKAVRAKKTPGSNGDSPGKTKKSVAPAAMPEINLDEEIRRRAFEIYEERGGVHGLDQDDWYRAEQEVRARFGQRSA